jgi:hypothetical protein
MSEIQKVSWEQFQNEIFRWKQAEQVAIIAPTGAGKTTLEKHLIPFRGYNIFFGTKPDDKLYHQILKEGFVRKENFGDIRSWENNVLLWPKQRKTIEETMNTQFNTFKEAMDQIVLEKGWTVWFDEAKYISQMLGLRKSLEYCVEQLRSIHSTTICGAQRPSWIPASVLAGATHIFLWKTTHREDLQKLSDVGGIDATLVRNEAKSLGKHEFIYIESRGTQTKLVISQTPA